VIHTTANGKFGQTWVETFEDFQAVRKYNGITDLIFSPFQKYMDRTVMPASGYEVFKQEQNSPASNLMGHFKLDKTQSHTGLFSLYANSATTLRVKPWKYEDSISYYSNLFDFNLDDSTGQKFTYEVWVKASGSNIASPSVTINGVTSLLNKV